VKAQTGKGKSGRDGLRARDQLTARVHASQLPKNFVYGINPVREALRANYLKKAFIGRTDNPRVKELISAIRSLSLPILPLSEQRWFPALKDAIHQEIAGITKPFVGTTLLEALSNEADVSCVVMLDGVNDPHNLGAAIRNVRAAGAVLILPKHGVPEINATVHKVSAGCSFSTPIVLGENLSQAIDTLKKSGFWVAAMDAHRGESIFKFEFPKKFAVIFGREERGVRRILSEKSDFLLRIPMANGVDSLNLSSAVAVTVFLFRAQHSQQTDALIP